MADVQVALPVPVPTPTTTLADDEDTSQVATTPPVAVPVHPVVEATIEETTPTPPPNDVDDVVEGRESQAPSTETEAAIPTIPVQDAEVANTPEVQNAAEPQNVGSTDEGEAAAAAASSSVPPPLPVAGTGEDTAPAAEAGASNSNDPDAPAEAPAQGTEVDVVDAAADPSTSSTSTQEDFEVDLMESFPYTEEEDIDLGTPFTGTYIVYEPTPEILFAFEGLEDDELPGVVNGNFASFFEMMCGHEFYRNYVRGATIRKLRTAKDAVKGKPNCLTGLFQLPLEVLYDVLELAHPMDLLHLSRSSKALRSIILSKQAENVWKNAYDHYQDLPRPPKELSPPKWTAMMFDDSRCDFCGQPGALLDFALNEHYCESCQRKYLVEQNDMVSVTDGYPRLLPILYQVLVPTYRQSGGKYQTYYESDNNARYRRRDVEEMIETLQTWYMTIDEGMCPEAGQKFEEWSQELITKSRAISDYAGYFNNWATSYYYNICNEMSMKQRTLADKCMKKFTKLGFDERDTDAASSDVYYYFRGVEVCRLTPKILEKHKEGIIQKITTQKRERLKRERREFVDKFYKDYKKTFKPEKWAYFPPEDLVAYDDLFTTFIQQDTLENVEELNQEAATAKLPEIRDDWFYQRQRDLYEMLPGVSAIDDSVEVPTDESLTPEEIDKQVEALRAQKKVDLKKTMDERMKRATTIFSCISLHMCGSYPHVFHTNWEFCSVGYAAAASIIRQLGLDPDTAAPEDMDKIDARFFCGNCPVKTCKKVQGRKAYTWRECVTHAVEKEEDHTHAIPAWLVLSEEANKFVKAHETPYPSPRRENWACNHCPEHFDKGVLLKTAKAHIKEAHSIENPVTDVDVVYLKGRYERNGNGRGRSIFHYGIEPTCNLKCNLCRSGRVQRMWTIQALVPHLFHMHGISMPQSTRDYSKIEILAG
ncbi:hypothetical protein EST38_g3787 [Candolleomyces aberdarensis]|uniref:F-box domain-containing protein n=1 Tax=Candolleomyces aberdarensis TaxID=2316362 RepID=A0A4Q2DT93_9AGAR|nr:hypothetical protein EST38_g3787 [Candolleomyces aberdarensis]